MSKFKVGDRVVKYGEHGTVIDVDMLPGSVVAEMDNSPCGITVPQFPGKNVLWLPEDKFEKLPTRKILITANGKTTLARLYEEDKVVNRAEAKCSPEDTFDFAEGAKLAFERLMEEKPEIAKMPEPEKVKLYCVRDCKGLFSLTKGKTYDFVAGRGFPYDGGEGPVKNATYEEWAEGNRKYSRNLVRLVPRPAKVGEWIYISKSGDQRAKEGEIRKVAQCDQTESLFIVHPEGKRIGDNAANISGSEYLVLDGYQPEPKAMTLDEIERAIGYPVKVVEK